MGRYQWRYITDQKRLNREYPWNFECNQALEDHVEQPWFSMAHLTEVLAAEGRLQVPDTGVTILVRVS